MSDESTKKFHNERDNVISTLIDFIKAGQADERDIVEEMNEVLYEANQECGTKLEIQE